MKFPTSSLAPLLKLSLAMAVVVGGLYYSRQFTQRYVSEGLSRRAVVDHSLPVAPAVAAIGEFESAGIEALVRAAAVTDESLAKIARRELDAKIAIWRREAFAATAAIDVTERWNRLLLSLQNHSAEFTIDGRRWATQIALAGLEMDEVLPPAQSLPIAEASGKLLDELGRGTPPLATNNPPVQLAVEPIAIAQTPVPIVRVNPAQIPQIEGTRPTEVTPPTEGGSALTNNNWKPKWQTPATEQPQPLGPQPLVPAPIAPPSETPAAPVATKPFSELTDRELLASLLEHADELLAEQEAARSARGPASKGSPTVAPPRSPELSELRAALAERGYRTAPLDAVQMLLSPDVQVRRRLVDSLLTQNSSGSPRLLMLLAQDAAPEVRLAALSALSSSDDLEVVRAAWNLAMRDADPSVANLARQLTERVGSRR